MPKKILIVDDEEMVLDFQEIVLESGGYEVRSAGDAAQALNILDTENIDLVMLDVRLPGMDGLELCRQMKKNPKLKGIPVIFVTAKRGSADQKEGFEAGGVIYLMKPFTSEKLLTTVRAVLGE